MIAKTIRRLGPIHGALIETTDKLSIRSVYMAHVSLFEKVVCSFIGKDLSILLGKTHSHRIKELTVETPHRHFLNVSVPDSGHKTDLRAAIEHKGETIRIFVFGGEEMEALPDLSEELEAERDRIGRFLHDEVGQLLYAARLNLQHFLSQNQAHLEDITPTKRILGEAIQKIQKIARDLSPKTLLDFGLQSAIGEMVAKVQHGGIKVDGQLYGPENSLMESEKILIYRIFQELLNNSLKHSGGNNIRIVAKVERLTATVTAIDNGKGFHTTEDEVFQLGSGLASIRGAVRARYGMVKLKNTHFGTVVSVRFFLKGKSE